MKNFILLMIFAWSILTSCDSPRSQRSVDYSNSSTNAGNPSSFNLGNSNNILDTTSNGNTTLPSAAGTGTVIPSDATQCKFSTDGVTGFESTSSHLGDHTLCQSSSDKNVVYFQLKTPPTNASGNISICLIPTTNNGANSIYVGNAMCGYFTDPKAVSKITFIKYAQYSNATITGVLFFKDLSWYYYNSYMMTLEAYKTCMSMYASGNATYCDRFKAVGQYVYKQF